MNTSLLLIHLFIFFTVFTSKAFSSSSSISYSDHCDSFVREATPTDSLLTRYQFLESVSTSYTGGQKIIDEHRSIYLASTDHVFATNVDGTYKIQAQLYFYPSSIYYDYHPASNFTITGSNYSRAGWKYRSSLVFDLDGFWSMPTNTLCMVGSARWFTEEGNPLTLKAVLKLKIAQFMTFTNSLVSGKLESLSSPNKNDYFDPISMFGFPRVSPFRYNYTLLSNKECDVTKIVQNTVTSMKHLDVCSLFTQRFTTYKLEYPSNCKNCSLFGQDNSYLPTFVSLYVIQCSREDKKLRVLVEFQDRRFTPYDQSFRPNISLIGEGTWNGTKNELCIIACRILTQRISDPLGTTSVGDCSIRLSLWFPVFQSITKTHTTEGQIWTTKLKDDLGAFRMAKFQSFDHSRENYGSKYEYTQMEKVKRNCPKKKHAGAKYQFGPYYGFDMFVKHKNMVSRGFADPKFLGSRGINNYAIMNTDFSTWQEADATATVVPMTDISSSTTTYSGPMNISFEISFRLNISSSSSSEVSSLNLSSTDNHRVEISAEGIYDDETGEICMVGCRNLNKNASFDCEILVKFQLPQGKESLIKGDIVSLREKTDVFYFEKIDISSVTFTESEARESIWRMDIEIIMVLISDTLMCVFIGRQLLHLKKSSETVNSISVLMMLILTLGHMVPLVLNFEAIFSKSRNQENVTIGSNGLLEVNEVLVRIATMVAFILQSRLLQLTLIAKKNHWAHEIRTLFICLPMYIISGFAMLLVNWKNSYTISSQRSVWGGFRSYAGLTLDGFLFPQLVLNIFQFSKGNALSHWFYIGTTFVRLMPHVYDLYRGQRYISHQFDKLYIYANPRADFYSPSWDVVIICGGLVLAAIVFLQQCFGGRFMFPKRFREHVEYEMVPVTNKE